MNPDFAIALIAFAAVAIASTGPRSSGSALSGSSRARAKNASRISGSPGDPVDVAARIRSRASARAVSEVAGSSAVAIQSATVGGAVSSGRAHPAADATASRQAAIVPVLDIDPAT